MKRRNFIKNSLIGLGVLLTNPLYFFKRKEECLFDLPWNGYSSFLYTENLLDKDTFTFTITEMYTNLFGIGKKLRITITENDIYEGTIIQIEHPYDSTYNITVGDIKRLSCVEIENGYL